MTLCTERLAIHRPSKRALPQHYYPALLLFSRMPRRNSPQSIRNLEDLSQLDQVVVDKRLGQRSTAKKGRRNRHYEKQFIRNALTFYARSVNIP